MVGIEDAMLDLRHVATRVDLDLRDADLGPDETMTGDSHMAVLSNAHHRDRAVGVVNLYERPGGTSGHRAAVRGVGREEGDSDFDDDIVRLHRPIRQRRDRRRDGSHIVFKEWEAADGARLRVE